MANKFSKGHTFVPGEVVDPADLNELVDLALALPALITDQTAVSATTGDKVLVSRGGVLKQADVLTFPSGVTSVSATATPTSVFGISVATPSTTPTIALSLDNQTAGKVLAGPVSGGAAAPAFRVLSPVDLPISTVNVLALIIDWNLGSMFIKELNPGNQNLTFSNASEGQTIRVLLFQSATGAAATVGWSDNPKWPNGTNPVQTPHGIDIYTFHRIGGVYYGTFSQHFLP